MNTKNKKKGDEKMHICISDTQGKWDVSMGAWTLHWAGSTLHVMLF